MVMYPLRSRLAPFDEARARRGRRPNERSHQLAGLLADWLHENGVESIFLVGTGDGFYLAFWRWCGFEVAGCDLPADETPYRLVDGIDWSDYRVVWKDALALTADDCQGADALVSDACFEAMVPWRADGTSTIPKYAGGGPLDRLGEWASSLGVPRWAFIEPDVPSLRAAWGAPAAFEDASLSLLSPSTPLPLAVYSRGLSHPPFARPAS